MKIHKKGPKCNFWKLKGPKCNFVNLRDQFGNFAYFHQNVNPIQFKC